MKAFFIKISISFDYLINALAPASPAGMTISAHAGMAAIDGRLWGRVMVRFLNLFQKDHCIKAMQGDIGRAQRVINELTPYLSRTDTIKVPA